jgi:hypothetical protein
VRDLAVEDDDRLDALLDGVDAGLDLGDHAVRDSAVGDQIAALLDGELGDELLVLVEDPGDVREEEEALRSHGAGDGASKGVGVDVVGLAAGADRHGR